MSELTDKTTGNRKSVVRLDKNLHLYIHGDKGKVEESKDEKGKFLKVYYEEIK